MKKRQTKAPDGDQASHTAAAEHMAGVERLNLWRMRAQRSMTLQFEEGRKHQRWHYYLGVPTVILSAFVSTLGFVGLAGITELWIVLAIAFLGSVATILASLQTFLNLSARSQAHHRAGVRFGAVVRGIETYLATPTTGRTDMALALTRFQNQMDIAASEAPPINDPSGILKKLIAQERGIQDSKAVQNNSKADQEISKAVHDMIKEVQEDVLPASMK